MIAPGAEEFLAPAFGGPWLPPERTFSPVAGERVPRRARALSRRLFEHDFAGTYSFGVRRFFQGIDNQATTIFGMRSPSGYPFGGALLRGERRSSRRIRLGRATAFVELEACERNGRLHAGAWPMDYRTAISGHARPWLAGLARERRRIDS